MSEPSSSQSGGDGLPTADKSASGPETTLKDMKQQQEMEMGSSEELPEQTTDSKPSVQESESFDEQADRTGQSGRNEQVNKSKSSEDEVSMSSSDSGPSFQPSQLSPADDEVEKRAQGDQLSQQAAKNEIQEATNNLNLPLEWDFKYDYRPLSSPDSTRILVLLPAQNTEDNLRCSMDEVRLSDVEDNSQGFTALSYVWGTDEAYHMIWFENRALWIRPNLDSALRNIRRRDRTIRVWVDAVCIDQDNLLERNHQVQQMRDIFSAASETVIYLGTQDGGNTGLSAWNFLERHSSWALDENRDIDRNVASRLGEHLIHFRGDLKDVELDVLSRSWFRRLWVFQEAVVSRSLSIQCGNRRISWDDFCKLLLILPRVHDRYGFSFEGTHNIDIVRHINISRRDYLRQRGLEHFLPSWQLRQALGPWQGDMDILALLSRARHLEASDARDKIYGLVGISTGINTEDSRFAIDYRLNAREVYVKFARNHIEATKSYDVFSYVDAATESLVNVGPSHQSTMLPSWVPNWHYQEYISYGSNRTILETLPMETPAAKKARQNRVADGYYMLSTQWDAKTMVVPGRIIGRIERYTLPLRLLGMTEVLFQDARNSIADDSQRFTVVMEMWEDNLYFDRPALRLQDREVLLIGPGGEITAFSSPTRSKAFASLFQKASMMDHTSVEYHLYSRARQTASWSDESDKSDYVLTDKESIVDGKRLAICAMETEGVRWLALVPSMAHEQDFVIQISGCRVPFVVKATPDVAWPGETVDPSKYSGPLTQMMTCQIVGECLLNDFQELPEDKMDTMFVIV